MGGVPAKRAGGHRGAVPPAIVQNEMRGVPAIAGGGCLSFARRHVSFFMRRPFWGVRGLVLSAGLVIQGCVMNITPRDLPPPDGEASPDATDGEEGEGAAGEDAVEEDADGEEGAPATPGLVAYWPMDETAGGVARDASGRGNDAAVEGAFWTAGRCRGGIALDGVDDDLRVPDAAALRPETTRAFTWMSWVWLFSIPPSPPGEYPLPRIMDKAWCYSAISGSWSPLGCPNPCFEIGAGDNDLEFWPHRDLHGDGSACLEVGTWAHVAFVFDGAGRRVGIFIDGRRFETEVITAGPDPDASWGFGTAGADLYMGRGGLNAVLDEVRVYDRALADGEVAALFAEGCSP